MLWVDNLLASSAVINKNFAKLNCPVPNTWLAIVNSSAGCFVCAYGVYLSLPIANNNG